MIFNSFQFLIFFPIVTFIYYLLSQKYKKYWLLLASIYFYGSFIPKYLLILFLLITIDFFSAQYIGKITNPKRKKILLITSILTTILILVIFKYLNFFNEGITEAAAIFGLNYPIKVLNVILPIGLSFHTFQSLAYVIEVYNHRYKPEKNILIYSLYVMFYPQLVAGPIERPQNLLTQLNKNFKFDYYQITTGLKMIAWGAFKKVVLADRMAILVNHVYGNTANNDGVSLTIATVIFAFQIYCDFSGYSDIAIGSAKTLGINLSANFFHPYYAKSISEFWHRWHYSLSSWFRDYVYIPLGGNRVKYNKWARNILMTFALSGLWHGSSITYLIWGILHGILIIFENIGDKVNSLIEAKKNNALLSDHLSRLITFTLVCISWVFFRSASLHEAVSTLKKISNISKNSLNSFSLKGFLTLGITSYDWLIIGIGILLLFIPLFFWKYDKVDIWKKISEKPIIVRWFLYTALIISIIYLGKYSPGSTSKFIYFQF